MAMNLRYSLPVEGFRISVLLASPLEGREPPRRGVTKRRIRIIKKSCFEPDAEDYW
jgi:hypothetical protein